LEKNDGAEVLIGTIAKDSDNFDSNRSNDANLATPSVMNSTISSLGMNNRNELPYIEAIKSFEKMQTFTSPREKL
jgi:hypothetical protein